jgi:DNA-binding IclR family transcriptional regulator
LHRTVVRGVRDVGEVAGVWALAIYLFTPDQATLVISGSGASTCLDREQLLALVANLTEAAEALPAATGEKA